MERPRVIGQGLAWWPAPALTSFRAFGRWHARFPGASRALCGVSFRKRRGRPPAPNCPTCIAAVFAATKRSERPWPDELLRERRAA